MKTLVPFLIFGSLFTPADALAQSESFSSAWGPSTPAFSDTLSFPIFNSNLGTLTSANITLTSNVSGEVDVFDALASQETISGAYASFDVSITGPDGATTLTNLTATVPSGLVLPGFNSFPDLTISNSETVSILDLAPFEAPGGGILNSTVAGTDTSVYGGTSVPGVFFGGTTTAAGEVQITYNYAAVSEPEEPGFYAAFLGAAAFGIGLIRRKRSTVIS